MTLDEDSNVHGESRRSLQLPAWIAYMAPKAHRLICVIRDGAVPAAAEDQQTVPTVHEFNKDIDTCV